jgi:hypothetical protein
LFEHNPGSDCTATSLFLVENALMMNLVLCTSASLFCIYNFTAFETAGPDTKTELAEMESNFQKG